MHFMLFLKTLTRINLFHVLSITERTENSENSTQADQSAFSDGRKILSRDKEAGKLNSRQNSIATKRLRSSFKFIHENIHRPSKGHPFANRLCSIPVHSDHPPSFFRKTQPALDYGGRHEPRARMLRTSRCHYPEHRRPGKGKRSLQPRLRLGSGLLALALLPDQRILPTVSRHPTDAPGFPYPLT